MGLKFIGDTATGEFMRDVPARDIPDSEIPSLRYDVSTLVSTGLYEYEAPALTGAPAVQAVAADVAEDEPSGAPANN